MTTNNSNYSNGLTVDTNIERPSTHQYEWHGVEFRDFIHLWAMKVTEQ